VKKLYTDLTIHFLVNRRTSATEIPISAVPSTNHRASGIPTIAITANPTAARKATASESTCITRKGPGWRAGYENFMPLLLRRFLRKASAYGSLKSTVTRVWKSVGSLLCQYGL
jgi:hypothetical protein